MRSEALHTTPQGIKPGETVTDSGIILPSEVGRQKNVRETIQFDHPVERADKYNSPGVDPDNPYNAFAPESSQLSAEPATETPNNDKYQLSSEDQAAIRSNLEKMIGRPLNQEVDPSGSNGVLEEVARAIDNSEKENQNQNEQITKLTDKITALESKIANLEKTILELSQSKDQKITEKELAPDQPQRVRMQNGVTERLVKYDDGSFEWVEIISDNKDESIEDGNLVGSTEKDSDNETVDEAVISEQVQERLKALRSELDEARESGDTEDEYRLTDEIIATIDSIDGLADEHRARLIEGIQVQNVANNESVSSINEEVDDGDDIESFQPPELEIKPELLAAIDEAGDRYAKETARLRKGYVGHLLRNSKYWSKVPGLQSFANLLNEKLGGSREADEAREAYEQSITALQDEIDRQYIESVDEEVLSSKEFESSLRIARELMLLEAQPALENKIVKERERQSGKTNKFVNWWVDRTGTGGKVIKGLTVGAVGVGVGLTASLLTVPAIGGVLGGAAGLAIANYVTKRRANAVGKDGLTLAARQSAEDLNRQQEFIQQQTRDETIKGDINLTGGVEDSTTAEQRGNRARAKTATAIGFAGGSGGAISGELIKDAIESAAPEVPSAPEEARIVPDRLEGSDALIDEPPEVPPEPELLSTDFNIQSGSGFTQELMDFAGANGHSLTPNQSWELHQDLLKSFGNYIQDSSGNPINTYNQGGDLRISAPGSGQWAPGVAEFIKNWMTTRGLW